MGDRCWFFPKYSIKFFHVVVVDLLDDAAATAATYSDQVCWIGLTEAEFPNDFQIQKNLLIGKQR